MKNIDNILNELYSIDPSLIEKKDELTHFISQMQDVKPIVNIDNHFRQKLKLELNQKITEDKLTSKSNIKIFYKILFSTFGIVATFVFGFVFLNEDIKVKQPFEKLEDTKMSKTDTLVESGIVNSSLLQEEINLDKQVEPVLLKENNTKVNKVENTRKINIEKDVTITKENTNLDNTTKQNTEMSTFGVNQESTNVDSTSKESSNVSISSDSIDKNNQDIINTDTQTLDKVQDNENEIVGMSMLKSVPMPMTKNNSNNKYAINFNIEDEFNKYNLDKNIYETSLDNILKILNLDITWTQPPISLYFDKIYKTEDIYHLQLIDKDNTIISIYLNKSYYTYDENNLIIGKK